MHICLKRSRLLICSEAQPDKAQTTLHKPIPTSKVGRDFYYQNSNQMWFEIMDIEDYETDLKKMSVQEMEKGNKNYLLKNDK